MSSINRVLRNVTNRLHGGGEDDDEELMLMASEEQEEMQQRLLHIKKSSDKSCKIVLVFFSENAQRQ